MSDEKHTEEVNENVPGDPVTAPTPQDIYTKASENVANSPEFAEVDEKELVDEELDADKGSGGCCCCNK